MISNAIVTVTLPLFRWLHQTLQGAHQSRASLMTLFEEAGLRCLELGLSEAIWEEAKFVMAAFIDEMILNEPHCSLHAEWSQESLQLMFFKEHLAGETFFERLSELKKTEHHHILLLELYYWCLFLGYQGKYHQAEHSELEKLIDSLRSLLQQYATLTPPLPMVNLKNKKRFSAAGRLKKSLWWIALIICVGSYFSVQQQIRNQVKVLDELVKQVK